MQNYKNNIKISKNKIILITINRQKSEFVNFNF